MNSYTELSDGIFGWQTQSANSLNSFSFLLDGVDSRSPYSNKDKED